ncbi:hypothetical protein K440DRAFT_106500 [Wilcoxina mikolae CBS 423.85]|nr:hypothetical protein K440DRAFT_106500 [Wilcoxina mikolae CBS 423.85]
MPAQVLSTLASFSVYLFLGSVLVLVSAVILLIPLRNKPARHSTTPPRSVSPDLSEKPKLPLESHGRPSVVALLTNAIPSSRRASTSSASPMTAQSPVTNRSKQEIAIYGDFPDYATLSGVPLPKPYTEFDIVKALPRPYRPFRWAYHQTMSFKKMEPDWWLELENTYVTRIAQRKELYAKHGAGMLQSLPGSEAATKEVMEMALQFLVARYPQYFSLQPPESPDVFVNRILGKEFSIRSSPPLEILLENVPEDFAITIKNQETGEYEFRAGVICSSLGWNVASKIGLSLKQIHEPIPDYKEKMSMSMDRYFSKMPTNMPIQRGSWGLEYLQPLYMPPNDPHAEHRNSQNPDLKLEDVFIRVDWQTLRRLPLSGAIVFNFKALFTLLTEVADEPGVPAVILEVLEKGKRNLMEYKNTWHVEHVAKPALKKWKEEQVQTGLVSKEWEVETLEQYPLFEGWMEKWHRQQGF